MMDRLIGFNIALPDDPTLPLYTTENTTIGIGSYGEWTEQPTTITLDVEPYDGDTQFLVEWCVDDQHMTPDHIVNVLAGIRHVAETLKIERNFAVSNLRITVLEGFHASNEARAVRIAAINAFEAALEAAQFVALPQTASRM